MFGKKRVAIVGAGLTLFRRRMKETGKELSYEARRWPSTLQEWSRET